MNLKTQPSTNTSVLLINTTEATYLCQEVFGKRKGNQIFNALGLGTIFNVIRGQIYSKAGYGFKQMMEVC